MRRLVSLASLCLALLFVASTATAAPDWHTAFSPGGGGPLDDDRADGRLHDQPELAAYHMSSGERIVVDGVLDDDVWQNTASGYGLLEHDPERRTEASVPTVFKIAYDHEALYLAAACWENDVDDISRRFSRRDDIQNSDFISFYVDPYHDHLSGYNFRVTADGVQADHYLYEDVGRDTDWNAVWDAETTEDRRGWYLEIRIPLAAMRFRSHGSDTWGLQFYRWLHGRGEDTGWATWERDQNGFVSRWGTLTGMRAATSPQRLEITPYLATGLEDRALPDDDEESYGRYLNLGGDLRYTLTSALTAQFTIQPDFGQVEADPALVNLSPFETYFREKRPFFVEGARFFEHPDFNMFYSRRIGTGEAGSRIRSAAKLTGKVGTSTNIGLLGALTDVTHPEKVHNPFVAGEQRTGYGVARVVQEFDDGRHRLGAMGTGVWRADDARRPHDAVSLSGDGQVHFNDREWRLQGSFVYTRLQPHDETQGSEHGTAARAEFARREGNWRGGVRGHVEQDRFNPNDIGFLSANDEVSTTTWGQYRYNADGAAGRLKTSANYVQFYRSWIYGDQRRLADDGSELWAHDKGHRQGQGLYFSSWNQNHDNQELELELGHNFEGTSKHNTRGGPLMTTPSRTTAQVSTQTDWRRDVVHEAEFEYGWSPEGEHFWEIEYGARMNLGRHFFASVSVAYDDRHDDAHWLLNEASATGIGGTAYVFAELDQQTLDATIRASYLPSRDLSLELYLQPYLTTGQYRNARYLATPDTRDLRAYDRGDGSNVAGDEDFTFGALNLNLVARWEYHPGSTIFLVFTHGRYSEDLRSFYADNRDFDDRLRVDMLFNQEPRSTVLLKVNRWFSI